MINWRKQIYEYCNIKYGNQIVQYLRKNNVNIYSKNYFDILIEYLLYDDGWLLKRDFKIKFLDTLEELYFFKDDVYKKYKYTKDNSIYYGFLFKDNNNKRLIPNIDKNENIKNLEKINIKKNYNLCINTNGTFKYDPITGYTNTNTRYVYKYIFWKHRINPRDLLQKIVDNTNIKRCSHCGLYYIMDKQRCDICEEYLNDIKEQRKITEYIFDDKENLKYKLINSICPFCDKHMDPKILARHIYKKHLVIFNDFLNKNFSEKCECGEYKQITNTWQYIINFNKKLDEIFFDFDFYKNFTFFQHTCNNKICVANNRYITIKKIYSWFMNKNKTFSKEFNSIRYYYKKFDEVEFNTIKYFLSVFRDYNNIHKIKYKGFIYNVDSNLEEVWSKNIIDMYKPIEFITGWNIQKNNNKYTFNYIDDENKNHLYIPDFYVKNKNGEYIFEIKSHWTAGLYSDHLSIINKDRFINVCKKFFSLKTKFNKKNIFIIIDKRIYTYDEFKDWIWKLLKNSK